MVVIIAVEGYKELTPGARKANKVMTAVLLVCAVIVASLQQAVSTDVRGVNPSKANFYRTQKDFTCLDGSITIPFSLVNDDYCDCRSVVLVFFCKCDVMFAILEIQGRFR